MRKPRIPTPPPTDILQAIGTLVITASAVDQQIALQILRMISPVNFLLLHAWPVVAGMDFRVKLAMVRSLAAHHGDVAVKMVSECCDKLQVLYTHRNRLAHSVFSGLTKSGKPGFKVLTPTQEQAFHHNPFA